MPDSRRAEALRLAEELLGDIEYSRVPPTEIAKKASRLARLLDDADAMIWLRLEVSGYTPLDRGHMSPEEVAAAERSARVSFIDAETKKPRFTVASLGWLQASAESSMAALAQESGGPSSSEYALAVENARIASRNLLIQMITQNRAQIDAVVGAIHEYVSVRFQELRFGSTIEGAFEQLRSTVDLSIGSLVPTALPKLNAALENATSNSPEHWANAASTCRRLVKEVADVLRPPGDDVEGRKMGKDNYVNRLVDWIASQPTSKTAKDAAIADLEFFGRRLDAVDDAGHKGAHADVSQFDASRFLVGTYVLLGDVLRIADTTTIAKADRGAAPPIRTGPAVDPDEGQPLGSPAPDS